MVERELGTIRDEVSRSIAKLGVQAHATGLKEARMFFARVRETFGIQGAGPLWESGAEWVSLQDKSGWSKLGAFLGDEPAVLFFDAEEEGEMFLFERGRAIVEVLYESFGFEFYVSDPSVSFLISFNHHDFLGGLGTAANWVGKLATDRDGSG